MELKLNIYNDKREIEKTYTAETVDLFFGTVEDLLNLIDLNKIDDKLEMGKTVLKAIPLLKPFLKDVFVGLTNDELRRTKITELVPLFVNIFVFAFNEFGILPETKN